MDLYFQGLAWLNKGPAPENVAQARGFFDRSLAADPGNVDALVGSARADVFAYAGAAPMSAFADAEAKLTKALSSVPDHARAQQLLGLVYMFTKRAAEGIAECEHALELDRNLASTHFFLGLAKIFIGRAEETEAHVAEALRLSPRDPLAYMWAHAAGTAKSHLGSWEESVAWRRRADRGKPKFSCSIFFLGRRPRAAWPTGRGAFRGQGRSRAQPGLHHFPRPRRLDGVERRPDVSGPARAHSRRHAQGRSAGGMKQV